MLFTALAFGLAQAALADAPTTNVPPLILSGRQSARPAGTYSAGIADIIKMLDAKVDAPVIAAYVQNSTIPYHPDATELLALTEHGASTELLMALLHRGDELRFQVAQAQSTVSPPPPAPAYENPPDANYLPYPYEYPDAASSPYPATYYSYGYVCGWPLADWPSGAHRPWASAAPLVPQAATPVFAPSGEHISSPVVHSGGWRSSGRSGGRSGGRSR